MTDTSKSFARETLDEIRSKLTDANAAACGMIEQSTRRQHFTDVRYVTVRWEPYKPDGARQMKAKGRWQEQVGSGDYFRWANCDRPAFAHDPETIEDLRAQLAAANARADAARDAALVEAADKLKSVYRVSITRVGGVDVYGSDAGSPASCYHTILALRDKPAPGVSVRAYLLRHKDTGRECIIDAKRYDPTKLDYWINPAAMASVEITPLGAIAGGGNELQTAPAVTVQEAARVLLGVFEDPDANAPHGFDWQSMYDEMTADHKESLDICGTHDWPSTLIVALRAIAASEA